MRSLASPRFWAAYQRLPPDIRSRARESYRLFRENPRHPGLQFKKVHPTQPIHSVRITQGWRALCLVEGETATWFWIGGHDDYERLISRS